MLKIICMGYAITAPFIVRRHPARKAGIMKMKGLH
jgi:hypothetical protein